MGAASLEILSLKSAANRAHRLSAISGDQERVNLVPQIGMRSVYSHAEVAKFCGLTERQIKSHVQRGTLKKKYSGAYPFDQGDVNQFLTALNSGKAYRGRSA